MKKLQDIDESKMQYNPFVQTLLIEATRITDSHKFIADDEGIMVPVTALIEKQRVTKIYHCPGCKEMVYNLSPSAQRLYIFILYNLEPSDQYIQINVDWYMKKNDIKSVNTYKDAAKELCRYLFIAQSPDYKNVYWINPQLFFNGNRIEVFPDNVKIKGHLEV